jgi:catechol 2,3-dioxygenase-like lactoylglutathione lyase family enzyme
LGVSADFVPATKAHPALLVKSLRDLVVHLEEHGIKVRVDQPLEGFNRCYADDPFGNRIEFMERIDT